MSTHTLYFVIIAPSDRIGKYSTGAFSLAHNAVIQAGDGTPDVTQCAILDGLVVDKFYEPRGATSASDGRSHPDIFYLGWSQLDARNDLRFPTRGFGGDGFEDKLFVSRKVDGQYKTWQLLPRLDENYNDSEKIRIHSFDVAPGGKTLFISMRRQEDTHLGIYEFDFTALNAERQSNAPPPDPFSKITHRDDSVHYLYPTYVGDSDGARMLFVSKTVDVSELPMNYGGPASGTLLDEYDRAATPLIHILNAKSGQLSRIGYNNSHQLEPISVIGPGGTRLVVFTQWEHQQTTNRFSLWKIQLDGSDNFTFFGQESATDRSGAHVFQPRQIKSGPFTDYVLMTQGRSGFIADGSIAMTKRENLDLRSERIFLDRHENGIGIARNAEHYNDQSMVYAYRRDLDTAYGIHIKDYPDPDNLQGDTTTGEQVAVITNPNMHFVQPRSYYPPPQVVAQLYDRPVGESRSSFTNDALLGKAGFLVQNLTESDNGVQHQLDGIDPRDIRLQFFIPSHTIGGDNRSEAIGRLGWNGSPELSVPASGFIAPEEQDGSLGVILNPGLYVWKVHKRFDHNGDDIWIPIRAERQEISFVPNRLNACNQCHQERSEDNIITYQNLPTVALTKMESETLDGVTDITGYQPYNEVPDFHKDIMPLLARCADSGCHDARDKLDLSNESGWRPENATWLALARGGHKLADTEEVVPYIYNSINPTGFDNDYHPAPFLWALLLGDDLSEEEDLNSGFPNDSSRPLTRAGDYGATYDDRISAAITAINATYDHTLRQDPLDSDAPGVWYPFELQDFITYSTTQSMVGLSDRITFQSSSLSTSSAAAQKAYQAMVKRCFNCHNNHATGGVDDPMFGKPQEKRFRSDSDLRRSHLRFVVDSHKAEKTDMAYSPYIWQSNIDASMSNTLRSALDRIDFDQPNESQLLVYARCDGLDPDHLNHRGACLSSGDAGDYDAIANWVTGGSATNAEPTIDPDVVARFSFEEYAEPEYHGPIVWSDPDPENDLSQLFINRPASSEHTINDTMLALNYLSFTEAEVQTYAILGDRGERELEFVVSDGQANSAVQTVTVEVTSTYIVPPPSSALPDFSAFYTKRDTGELVYIDQTGAEESRGFIPGYSPAFTTVYRRVYRSVDGDKGLLYFVNQDEQRLYVVDEETADVLFTIPLDHGPNKESDSHRQTVYLIWWRPAEYDPVTDRLTRPGELQALLESRQGDSNGAFYGFNQDLNADPVLFSFDPLERVQTQVPLEPWLVDLMSRPQDYGTPFVVVPRANP